MAEARPFELDLNAPEHHTLPAYRRLGLLNGLIIGLALGLGAWGLEMVRVARLPLPLAVPALLVGVLFTTLLGGFVGWLSARIARTVVTVVLWVAAGVVAMLAVGYAPFLGRSVVVWLTDPRFFGRQIFPSTLGGTTGGLILGGVLIFLVLGVLGLLQNHRLEGLVQEMRGGWLPSGRAWLALLLPLPIVFLIAMATSSVIANPAALAAQITHGAILRAQTIEGDLRDVPGVGNTGLLRGTPNTALPRRPVAAALPPMTFSLMAMPFSRDSSLTVGRAPRPGPGRRHHWPWRYRRRSWLAAWWPRFRAGDG